MHAPPPERILIVDDSESNLYVLSTWLRRAGYDIVEARTGEDAQRHNLSRAFDLAIVDINLPDMSGYDVARSLKLREPIAPLPVLHISSVATGVSDRSEGLRRGAEGFLVRPVEREELLATVESLLRGAASQRTAIALSQRLRRLNDATQALNSARDTQSILSAIASQAALLFESTAIVLDAGPNAASLRSGPDGVIERGDIDPACVTELARQARVCGRSAGREVARASTLLRDSALYLSAALDGNIRVLLVDAGDPAYVLEEDAAVLDAFARAASTALQNMRKYDVERAIALKLQQSLLPSATPRLGDLDIVTRYAASEANVEIGGDFYEAFALDEHRVVIAIGDVVGHSLDAAIIMAQLCTAIRCFALEGHAPDSVVARLNHVLKTFHQEVTATVCCGVYDTRTGIFAFANAGHIPPLVCSNGLWQHAPLGGSLLGIGGGAPPVQQITLHKGDRLVLYTDGLIERRGEDLADGMERLRQAAATPSTTLSQLCDVLLEAGGGNLGDDVAVVAIERSEG